MNNTGVPLDELNLLDMIRSGYDLPATRAPLYLEDLRLSRLANNPCTQQLARGEIAALKKSLLRQEIRRTALSAVPSTSEQTENGNLISRSTLNATFTASSLNADHALSSRQQQCYSSRYLCVPTARVPSPFSHPLTNPLPLFLSTPRLLRTFSTTATSFPHVASEEISASNLISDGSSTFTSSTYGNNAAQAPSDIEQANAALLHHHTRRGLAMATPLASSHFERNATQRQGLDSFPVIFHQALLVLDLVAGGHYIASFLPEGKSFQIKNQFLFEKHILPVFFPKMKNFASFQRQLNLYDFQRIGGAGVDRGAYRHDLFERESPGLASLMRRARVKGGSDGSKRLPLISARLATQDCISASTISDTSELVVEGTVTKKSQPGQLSDE